MRRTLRDEALRRVTGEKSGLHEQRYPSLYSFLGSWAQGGWFFSGFFLKFIFDGDVLTQEEVPMDDQTHL